ncbi:MAG: DUF2321 domain-containing protein [Thermodesulfobacteriota bacterium]
MNSGENLIKSNYFRRNWYDVAQVCLNGHVMNLFVGLNPYDNKDFCDKCGIDTITNCLHCIADIRGGFCDRDIALWSSFILPAFCPNCGKPYRWTETKIQTARELAQELENISDEEKRILTQSIDEIVKDTPKTTIAATRRVSSYYISLKPCLLAHN